MDDYIKKTIAVYDQIAEAYTPKIDNYTPIPEIEKFTAMIPPGGRVLDAGCGPGRDSEIFADRGFKVIGIDLSEKLLQLARKRTGKATFLEQDLRALQFSEDSFNGIWACASLLHLKRDEILPVLTSFYKLLIPGGSLFVMVKEGTGEADVEDVLSPNFYRHFIYFTKDEVKNLLAKGGFTINEIYTWDTDSRNQKREKTVWISSFSKKKDHA